MNVNQQKIAEELGISRTTVSRCFTNHSGINPQTRASVFATATRLGYSYMKPRGKDKNKSVSTKTIAVLICSDPKHEITNDDQSPGMQLLPGISEYALINQLRLDMKIINPTKMKFDPSFFVEISKAQNSHWDGILLIYPFPSEIISSLMHKYPCVSLVEQFGAPDLDCIDVDHHRGVSHLMQKLINQGHKRIGFFSRRYQVEAPWVYRRYSAYVEKLARASLPYRVEDVLNVYETDTYDLSEISKGDIVILVGDFDPISIMTFFKLIELGAIVAPIVEKTTSGIEEKSKIIKADFIINKKVLKTNNNKNSHELVSSIKQRENPGIIFFLLVLLESLKQFYMTSHYYLTDLILQDRPIKH